MDPAGKAHGLQRSAPQQVEWGRVPYAEALARQIALWRQCCAGEIADTLVSCEHPPTITLGRHAPEDEIVAAAEVLAARGIAVERSDRGGRATVHAPGQAVVYPIVGVARLGLGPKAWVALLEDAAAQALAECGVEAVRQQGKPGLWARGGKIVSLGLRIRRGVSYHGIAVNVDLDRSFFDCIVPCGVAGERISSLADELGTAPPSRVRVGARVMQAISERIEIRSRP